MPTPFTCTVDFDDALYLGDGDDGVYFDAAQDAAGQWFMSSVVDCNTGNFTNSLAVDDGPYPTRAQALQAGLNSATQWCVDNHLMLDDLMYDIAELQAQIDAN